jgi:hypothetical protein
MGACCSTSSARQPRLLAPDDVEIDPGLPSFYIEFDSVLQQLQARATGELPPVRLLKVSWLLRRAQALEAAKSEKERAKLVLPRRQELEAKHPEAYASVEEVRELLKSGVVDHEERILGVAVGAISHAWLSAAHPDPRGEQLVTIATFLRKRLAENAHELIKTTIPETSVVFYECGGRTRHLPMTSRARPWCVLASCGRRACGLHAQRVCASAWSQLGQLVPAAEGHVASTCRTEGAFCGRGARLPKRTEQDAALVRSPEAVCHPRDAPARWSWLRA